MTSPAESAITLPTVPLLGVALGGPTGAALLWMGASFFGSWSETGLWPGLAAIGIAAAVSLGVLVALRPWKPRSILVWGGLLIAASTGRIVATLGFCLLLYSAARQPAAPLLFGAVAGLIPVLAGETIVASRRFRLDAS
jgi:hypothetical protein